MEFTHVSVLLNECIEGLNIKPDGIYVDATAGGAGHSRKIAECLTDGGKLICLDRDPDAVQTATERLKRYNAKVVRSNYSELLSVLNSQGIEAVDGVLMDLGVSSHQLDTPERGFSYHSNAHLDMRMSQEGISAYDLVNTFTQEELSRIIFEYGEEKFSRIKKSVPSAVRREKNPCKKTFQAIRIAVNGELEHLSSGLDAAFESLNPGGRLAVITFHSLEDRLVKQRFSRWCKGCICPPDFPQCVCGKKPLGKLINRKPIEATPQELEDNSRSRSAKLRIIERR